MDTIEKLNTEKETLSFDGVNKEVLMFYHEFHLTFEKIDAFSKDIANRGGKDSDLAVKILDILISHHNENKATDIDVQNIKSIEEFRDVAKNLQDSFHNALINDLLYSIPDQYSSKIAVMLIWLKNNISMADIDEVDYYASLHILKELVSDFSLFAQGLLKFAKWHYGTTEYSLLSAEEQFVLMLNQTILLDRMYLYIDSLETVLDRLNNMVDSFDELDWTVYYTVGLLNYKIHDYNSAHKYFRKIEIQTDLMVSDKERSRYQYFHSLLLIAYSHEYDGKFKKALQRLVDDPAKIYKVIDKYNIWDLDDSTVLNEVMENICNLPKADGYENEYSLFKLYIPSFKKFSDDIANITEDNKDTVDKQFEILHCFAHCLNEYAISERQRSVYPNSLVNIAENPINYGKLLHLARQIMLFISKHRPYYRTCYATIHGESKDYQSALEELNKANALFENMIKNKQQNELDGCELMFAEVSFYKYYFKLLTNVTSNKDKKEFEQYCRKYDDEDAECYLKIFEFRNDLQKYLKSLFAAINDTLGEDFSEVNLPAPSQKLVDKYEELCRLKPTLYLNRNVRDELRLIQRAFVCIVKLREYLIAPSKRSLLNLQNASQRFLIKNVELDQNEEQLLENIPRSIAISFSRYRSGVFNRLFNNDSIFILAPISEVKGFEYQTGKVSELFTIDNIISPTFDDSVINQNEIIDFASKLHDSFVDYSGQYRMNILSSEDWNEIFNYVEEIFYWNIDIPGQVLVAKSGKDNKNPKLFTRQIQDMVLFLQQLYKIQSECFKHVKNRCDKRGADYIRTLCIYKETILPHMEVVNDHPFDERIKFNIFLLKPYDNTSKVPVSCFILKPRQGKGCDRHKLHKLILHVGPTEYSDEMDNDERIVEERAFDGLSRKQNDEIFERILEFASRVKPKLQQSINKISKNLSTLELGGDPYNATVKKKQHYEELLELLNTYSSEKAKFQYSFAEHKEHYEELKSKEGEMIE